MGGKVWSNIEEKYFWRTAVASSPKRVGIDRARPERSWDELAQQMQAAMGGDARRDYTGTMLFEHYFQNIESQRRSPNAGRYVQEYERKQAAGTLRGPSSALVARSGTFVSRSASSGSRAPLAQPTNAATLSLSATTTKTAPAPEIPTDSRRGQVQAYNVSHVRADSSSVSSASHTHAAPVTTMAQPNSPSSRRLMSRYALHQARRRYGILRHAPMARQENQNLSYNHQDSDDDDRESSLFVPPAPMSPGPLIQPGESRERQAPLTQLSLASSRLNHSHPVDYSTRVATACTGPLADETEKDD